jgi:hypothetical protein
MLSKSQSTGVLPFLAMCLGPRTEAVGFDHLAYHEPIEQVPDGSEPLLHGRSRTLAGELLDVGGDMHRLDSSN